jgi:hypothetical protein
MDDGWVLPSWEGQISALLPCFHCSSSDAGDEQYSDTDAALQIRSLRSRRGGVNGPKAPSSLCSSSGSWYEYYCSPYHATLSVLILSVSALPLYLQLLLEWTVTRIETWTKLLKSFQYPFRLLRVAVFSVYIYVRKIKRGRLGTGVLRC